MKNKVCIDCGSKDVVERRRCKECLIEYNKKRAKRYYIEKGKSRREANLPKEICPICGKIMIMWTKSQGAHISCRFKCVNDYNKVPRNKDGTKVQIRHDLINMGIVIPKGYVIHHVDENPYNNILDNLWLMSIKDHNSLHRKLQYHRSLWLKNHNSNGENCWKPIRDHITTTWLETTSVNVIKVCDIWQSASEPLSSDDKYGEGSETMYTTPKQL